MFAANPRFARGESRISFDMLKSQRRVHFFLLSKTTNPKTLKTLNPKLKPENLKSKSLRIASVFIHSPVISIYDIVWVWANPRFGGNMFFRLRRRRRHGAQFTNQSFFKNLSFFQRFLFLFKDWIWWTSRKFLLNNLRNWQEHVLRPERQGLWKSCVWLTHDAWKFRIMPHH